MPGMVSGQSLLGWYDHKVWGVHAVHWWLGLASHEGLSNGHQNGQRMDVSFPPWALWTGGLDLELGFLQGEGVFCPPPTCDLRNGCVHFLVHFDVHLFFRF